MLVFFLTSQFAHNARSQKPKVRFKSNVIHFRLLEIANLCCYSADPSLAYLACWEVKQQEENRGRSLLYGLSASCCLWERIQGLFSWDVITVKYFRSNLHKPSSLMMNFTGLSEICTIYWLHYFKCHTNIQRNMGLWLRLFELLL